MKIEDLPDEILQHLLAKYEGKMKRLVAWGTEMAEVEKRYELVRAELEKRIRARRDHG
jgi:hypothetical protein